MDAPVVLTSKQILDPLKMGHIPLPVIIDQACGKYHRG